MLSKNKHCGFTPTHKVLKLNFIFIKGVRSALLRSGQVSQVSNLFSRGESLARGYFVAPCKEKKLYKIKLNAKVKLINKIMQKSVL